LIISPLSGPLGAEIHDISLSEELSSTAFDEIYQAFLEYQVVFFPDQSLNPDQHKKFSERFGEIDMPRFAPPFDMPLIDGHPEIYQLVKEEDDISANVGGFWHADVTHRERPNLASIAYVLESPSKGGDTLFSNSYLAYETLSSGMKNLLDSLKAVHSSEMPHGGKSVRSPAVSSQNSPSTEKFEFEMDGVESTLIENTHPVVRCHPDTGRKSLYVNRGFTSHFLGMTEQESLPLLNYLWQHSEKPEFTCRYRWSAGDVGIWDNRCVLHYALNDYLGERRVVHRISVNEPSRPLG
jgi:taurine dioxygenase